jgi:hypothetical protein
MGDEMVADGFGDREHNLVDLVVILAAVCLAVATWSYLSDAAGVPIWKSYLSVVITGLLALAAMTRNARWAAAIRLLTGAWLIGAPYLLGFADIATAFWTYLAAGVLVTTLAIPSRASLGTGRVRMAT